MRLPFGYIISFAAGAVLSAALIACNNGAASTDSIDTSTGPVIRPAQHNPAPTSTSTTNAKQKRTHRAVLHADRTNKLPSHEKVECCLQVAEDIDSQLAERLRQQNSANPDAFAVQLQHNGQRLLDLCTLRSQDPALYSAKLLEMQYDAKIIELGVGLCKAANQGNEQLVVNFENQLHSTLMMQLVFEIKARGEFLLKLQEEVERQRSELDIVASQFDTTVNTRLAEIKNCELPLRPTWQQRSRTVVPMHDRSDIPPE